MKVAALVPDLLFGSKVIELLGAAGHEVSLVSQPPPDADVLVCDLTQPGVDLAALAAAPGRVLGVYAHVEPHVREAALAAGLDLVVPRSRFMREGAALVASLSR